MNDLQSASRSSRMATCSLNEVRESLLEDDSLDSTLLPLLAISIVVSLCYNVRQMLKCNCSPLSLEQKCADDSIL